MDLVENTRGLIDTEACLIVYLRMRSRHKNEAVYLNLKTVMPRELRSNQWSLK